MIFFAHVNVWGATEEESEEQIDNSLGLAVWKGGQDLSWDPTLYFGLMKPPRKCQALESLRENP